MLHQFLTSLKLLIMLTLLTGIIYPIAITLLAQLTFHHKANGSILSKDDKLIGSELIGQHFNHPKYFWGRPSATSSYPYNAQDSSGSNFGPTNKTWIYSIKNRLSYLQSTNPNLQSSSQSHRVPIDLLTASGSGLDPHISIEAAQYQVPRIAKTRNLSETTIQDLILQAKQGHHYGSLLGTPRVHVLKLNLLLDALEHY